MIFGVLCIHWSICPHSWKCHHNDGPPAPSPSESPNSLSLGAFSSLGHQGGGRKEGRREVGSSGRVSLRHSGHSLVRVWVCQAARSLQARKGGSPGSQRPQWVRPRLLCHPGAPGISSNPLEIAPASGPLSLAYAPGETGGTPFPRPPPHPTPRLPVLPLLLL